MHCIKYSIKSKTTGPDFFYKVFALYAVCTYVPCFKNSAPSSLHTSICIDKHLKKLHHQHFVQMSSCWVCKVATNAIFTFIHQKEPFHLDNRVRLVVVGSIVSIYLQYTLYTPTATLCDMYNISTTYFCLIG